MAKSYDKFHKGGALPSVFGFACVLLVASTNMRSNGVDAFSIVPNALAPASLSHRSSNLRARPMVTYSQPSTTMKWAKTTKFDDLDSSQRWDGFPQTKSGTHHSEHKPHETLTEVEEQSEEHMVHPLTDMGKGFANLLKFAKTKHAALAATLILFFTVFMSPLPSMAVSSGGSMGGSFGASNRQSYSAPSRSYSSPRSFSSGYSRGFSSGYYSRPSVVINPTPIMPSPFYSPFWAPSYYSRPVGVVGGGGGFGIIGFITFFGFIMALTSALGSFTSSAGTGIMDRVDEAVGGALGPGVSVAEISVAVDVSNRDDPNSILNVLSRLSNTARTDSRVGMSNLTSQVALELLRRKNQIVASSTTSKHFRDSNKASREFNTLAVKERGKFERENRRYGGVDYNQNRRDQELTSYSPKATMAVVTLLVAVEGDSTKLPTIRSMSDIEESLSKIASDVKVDGCLQSAEILWTPEERGETLTMREVVSDYPELRSV